ncbi:MAG: sulfatase [Myxococcales bacterium]|nr:sulfatase [Myxococcales bacterium]HQY63845.1 sulfatase [Polyangiaceae bacterium]
MRPRRIVAALAAPVVIVLAAGGSLALAFSRGGGADPTAPPPRPPSAEAGPAAASPVRDGGAPAADFSVALRFTEAMATARVEAPRAGELDGLLAAHWRRLRPPFVRVPQDLSRHVSSFSLRTSEKEEQHAVSTGSGSGSWRPDARLWNMNEGSFDQRESIVLPTPASVSFPVTLPEGARVTFGAGTANASRKTLLFRVQFAPNTGAPPPACETRVPPERQRLWTDVTCDLATSALAAGRLTFGVTAVDPLPGEAPRRHRPSEAGAADDAALESRGQTPLALLGQPSLWGRARAVPYNVLWIVIDALRPDAIASFHDDARDAAMAAAELPPLEALLPKVPGLMPGIDALAKRGVVFRSATSAASWTRPGTLAMLSGARSSELGIETKSWVLSPDAVTRFYGSDPPLLPLLLRKHGAPVHAFVNNYFLVGYTPIGVDMGFEQVFDHRYRTGDTAEITKSAVEFLESRRDSRFFAFVNYNSPHDPYDPPAEMLARVPPPPIGPKDPVVRRYLGECAKDDAAVAALMNALDRSGLRERTLVVVTADHGETLSSAHVGKSNDGIQVRFHHSASNFEETTRVPILLSLPGVLPEGRAVDARVRSTDIAPTVLDLLGLERPAKMSGKSLRGLATSDVREAEPRVVVTEGRGTRSVIYGAWHFLVRDPEAGRDGGPGFAGKELLFDLAKDPGERHDLARERPGDVAELRARLDAAMKNVAVAGSAEPAAPAKDDLPQLHVRFAGGGRVLHVRGSLKVLGGGRAAQLTPVGVGADAFTRTADGFEVVLDTAPRDALGFDLLTDPPSADLAWAFTEDERPLAVAFGGPFGIARKGLERGLAGELERRAVGAPRFPELDPGRDVGLFVTRDRAGAAFTQEGAAGEGAAEMARMLREWGYANGSGASKK